MEKKYLNEIFNDEYDTLLGNQSIYQESPEELPENRTFTVTIVQPSSAIIEVVVNETDIYTESFIANWDDIYEVRFQDGYNPENLLLNAIQGKISRDITIKSYYNSTENKHETFTVSIIQSKNQTIKVLHNGVIKTNNFIAQRYDYYNATVEAIEGYTAGRLNNGSGSITTDVTISASAATKDQLNYKTVTITQTEHQTITVTYNGNNYTSSFTAPLNSTYTVSIKADEGYNAGDIIDGGDGIVYDDIEIHAIPAIIKKYTIYITQSAHQTIYVDYNGTKYTSTISYVPYGTQLTATLKPDAGYNAGTLNSNSYRVTSDFTFKVNSGSTVRNFNLTIPATTNQTITLTYKLPSETSFGHTTYSSGSVKTLSLPYETQWKASVEAINTDYLPGTLSATSGTISGDISITVSAAILNMYTLNINIPINGYVIVDIDDISTRYDTSTSIKVKKDKTVNIYAIGNIDYSCDGISVS